jgi:hypothetical protein
MNYFQTLAITLVCTSLSFAPSQASNKIDFQDPDEAQFHRLGKGVKAFKGLLLTEHSDKSFPHTKLAATRKLSSYIDGEGQKKGPGRLLKLAETELRDELYEAYWRNNDMITLRQQYERCDYSTVKFLHRSSELGHSTATEEIKELRKHAGYRDARNNQEASVNDLTYLLSYNLFTYEKEIEKIKENNKEQLTVVQATSKETEKKTEKKSPLSRSSKKEKGEKETRKKKEKQQQEAKNNIKDEPDTGTSVIPTSGLAGDAMKSSSSIKEAETRTQTLADSIPAPALVPEKNLTKTSDQTLHTTSTSSTSSTKKTEVKTKKPLLKANPISSTATTATAGSAPLTTNAAGSPSVPSLSVSKSSDNQEEVPISFVSSTPEINVIEEQEHLDVNKDQKPRKQLIRSQTLRDLKPKQRNSIKLIDIVEEGKSSHSSSTSHSESETSESDDTSSPFRKWETGLRTLKKLLEHRDLVKPSAIDLNSDRIMSVLRDLSGRSTIEYKKKNNKISATHVKDQSIRLNIHCHSPHHKKWYHDENIKDHFLTFVRQSEEHIDTAIKNIEARKAQMLALWKIETAGEKVTATHVNHQDLQLTIPLLHGHQGNIADIQTHMQEFLLKCNPQFNALVKRIEPNIPQVSEKKKKIK